MTTRYYKKRDIVKGTYYRIPDFVNADFSDIPAREIVWSEGDRLDVIAQIEFGNANYWRALALFNDIGDFFEMQPGDILRLPYDINKVLERI